MKPFAAKLKDGTHFVGLALDQDEVASLSVDGKIEFDLGSVGVGFWFKEADGSRSFIQPRDSKVVLLRAETNEEIGTFLGVKLP